MTAPVPTSASPPDGSSLDWDDDGRPRSRLYDDIYFSADGGLEESRAVFLQGCGLPGAWAGRRAFTIAELGFGTGLNIAAALDLWRQTRPAGGKLHLFSVEAHPISRQEAQRALAHWPELAEVTGLLVARWPGRARGFHRLDLPELDAVLDVAVMEAGAALEAWQGRADAWFLDGFSPAQNPQMWRQELLALVAARSAPGARIATYTIAGAVRRGLAAAGLTVERKPGFGRKRERLEARVAGAPLPEAQAPDTPPGRVAVIGAGIAGAALARAFRAQGASVQVFDAAGAGAGASGNPSALVTPRLDAGLGASAALFAQGFRRAVALYDAEGDAVVIARGALQLETAERDARRFAVIAAADLFEPGGLTIATAVETAAQLGEAVPAGLVIKDGLTIDPAALLAAWIGPLQRVKVRALVPGAAGWTLLGESGETLAEADVVCLAAGMGGAELHPDLGLMTVRGQASWAAGVTVTAAAAFSAYAIPTRDGVLFGATHDRDDPDTAVREDDNRRNLDSLAKGLPRLAERLAAAPLMARAALRATTWDHMPIAGALEPPGLFVLSGLGSRGFTLAPLLAEHVAALALDRPSPLPRDLARLTSPARIQERARKGGV